MRQYEQFSACLKRILEEEQLSASQVAKTLNMRSRNSIFRILAGQTSVRVQEAFLQTLKEQYAGVWSPKHWQDLEESLEISRIGVDDYRGRRALHALIHTRDDQQEMLLNIPRPHNGYAIGELRPVLEELFRDGQFTISICGCCTLPLTRLLAELLQQPGREGRVYMRHYVNMTERVVVQNVVAIQPLMYFNWYDPLMVEPDTCTEEMMAVYSAGTIFIEKLTDDGEQTYVKYIMYDHDKLYRVSTESRGIAETIRLLNSFGDDLPKLTTEYPANTGVEDYLRFTEYYRELESNKEVLSLKPDVPINYIHPDILLPAVLDGFRESGFVTEDADMAGIVQMFYDIHLQRYENFVKKRKVTHEVFSLEAMRKFMRTGEQSDHFFAMRPYTLAERLAILNHLRDESANNPYFSVHFLKPEFDHPTMEVTMFDGIGVLFTRFDSDYNLSGDHSEALITHPLFQEKFRDFFMHDLLPNCTMSHKESLNALAELARDAVKYG